MININYSSEEVVLDKKLKCKIAQLAENDKLEIVTEIIDEGNQKWQSIINNDNTSSSFEFDSDDIMLNLKYVGLKRRNTAMYIYEKINKHLIPKNHYTPKFMKFSDDDITLDITIKVNDSTINNKKIRLLSKSKKILKEKIYENFIGNYYYSDKNKQPAIIVIGGSMGDFNWSEQVAALLANYGFNTLAISYFSFRGLNKLPKILANIKLEYFLEAIKWLKNQKYVECNKIGIVGLSKGAEAALLLGSYFPEDIKSIGCKFIALKIKSLPSKELPYYRLL